MDNELFSRRFEIESKLFFLDLKENTNGRYLKITEKSGDKRSFIIVPEGGIESFIGQLAQFQKEYDTISS
ncbi:MAG TPA: DNA-binding protein [Thermodesulfobacteriota bacterium]|nr:DNA-binding protein [Deltaproteobacteria bacterium]HNR11982.1 DNA-binding protein [Thermodesulfobacteriota bacterium]HNU70802.1 DNA-binding protein [Thermodesulfobacteriota bacterium]HOC38923.1 DNA-binding protein [Thermodesulfobacteriota bacterium]HQO78742.1 DNA-binding protein [Thermodesulfobacteriota bacterium]